MADTRRHTLVPDVRAALQDTVLPAALAALPASITVRGRDYALTAPVVLYGEPGQTARPSSFVVAGGQVDTDQAYAQLPDMANGARTRSEDFILDLAIEYAVGGSHPDVRRVACESAYAIWRAIASHLRGGDTNADPWASSGFPKPFVARLSRHSDEDLTSDQGLACRITTGLRVSTQV